MTFLNAAVLAGTAALAIPILIHLFHKSRFQVVKWGAMHLLEAVVRTNRRRLRIEQIILLLVRAAIPAILALLMARPVWQGAQTWRAQQTAGDGPAEVKTSTVLLLDNSYSMEAGRAGASHFSMAREQAGRILGELKRGSQAQVVLMGDGISSLLHSPTYDTGRLTQALQQTTAGFGIANVPAALDHATSVLTEMHESARELVVLTDFQRLSFPANETVLLSEKLERLKKLPSPPHITFFNIGAETNDNVAIESLDFSRLMIGVGQKLQIRANLRNFGDADYGDLRVYFRADGKEKSVSQIALAPRQTGQVLFTHSFDTPGSHVVEVFADADSLKADNVFLASIPVRDKVPVVLVNGAPGAESLKGETDFAEIALQPYSAGRVELADLITTRVIKPEEIGSSRLADASVVILANVRKLNDEQVRSLEQFVTNGGGLLIFPGDRIDAPWYNRSLHKDGNGLLPVAVGALSGEIKESASSISIRAQRFENAALELFNDPRNGNLADSEIKLWFNLHEQPSAAGPTKPDTLARLENGDPFIVERSYGDGRVILCATALDADWSNLPMRPFYLPLLQRLSVYLASTVYPPRNLAAGEPLIAFLPASDAGRKASIATPDGSTIEVSVQKKADRGVVEFGKTQRPGLYALKPPAGPTIHYVVNASRRESDLAKLSSTEMAELARQHGVALVHSTAEYKRLDHRRRYGRELWKPLLWAILAVIFLELVLQQRFARARGKAA